MHLEGGSITFTGALQKHDLSEGCKVVLEEAWDIRVGIRGGDRVLASGALAQRTQGKF